MCPASKTSKQGSFPHTHSISHREGSPNPSLQPSSGVAYCYLWDRPAEHKLMYSLHEDERVKWWPAGELWLKASCRSGWSTRLCKAQRMARGWRLIWCHKNFWSSEIYFNFPIRRSSIASDGFHSSGLCQNTLKRSFGRLKRSGLSGLSAFVSPLFPFLKDITRQSTSNYTKADWENTGKINIWPQNIFFRKKKASKKTIFKLKKKSLPLMSHFFSQILQLK